MIETKLHKLVDKEDIAALFAQVLELTGGNAYFWLYGSIGKCIASSYTDTTPSPLSNEHIESIVTKGAGKIGKDCIGEPIAIDGTTLGALICHNPAGDLDQLKKWKDFVTERILKNINKEVERKQILHDSLEKYREINVLYNLGENI